MRWISRFVLPLGSCVLAAAVFGQGAESLKPRELFYRPIVPAEPHPKNVSVPNAPPSGKGTKPPLKAGDKPVKPPVKSGPASTGQRTGPGGGATQPGVPVVPAGLTTKDF